MGWPWIFNLCTRNRISNALPDQNTTTHPTAGDASGICRLANVPFLQILNPSNALLRVANHLPKEISKAGLTELLCAAAV